MSRVRLAVATLLVFLCAASAFATHDLIISEYVEGTSNNKAIELYNPTATSIDLAALEYRIRIYFNGATTATGNIALTGTIAAGGTFVVSHSSAGTGITDVDNQSTASLTFNGDDAIVLTKGAAGTVVDSLGQVGNDPGTEWGTGLTSTADNTLRRKSAVCEGDTIINDTFDPATQWDGFATDTFAGLGSHTISCAAPTPTLSINNVTQAETNAGTTTFAFTVTLSAAAAGPVTFDIATADNTATDADNDYEPNSVTGATIPAGETTYTFNVTVNGDTNIEATESFFVNVTNVNGATAGDTQGEGTITNDDSPPTLNIADPTAQAEGNAGTTTMTFTVTLDAPAPPGGVTFNIATSDGTATDADNDYEPNSVTGASIAAGSTTYSFPVTINGDTTFEPNETFTVTVTSVTGATAGDTSATGTINNDDAAPALAITDAGILEGNAGTQVLTFTVSLSAAMAGPVTVDFATADSSATVANADYVANSGTLTFVAGDTSETISVTINGDSAIEGDEQFFVNLTNVTGGAAVSDAQGLGVIKTDDAFSVAAVNTTYSENFDTLAADDTSGVRAATTPASWTFNETGTASDLKYRPSNGTTNTGNSGDTYSFGTTGSSDRAFGTVQSGSLTSTIGGQYVNNTGVPITTLSIAYTGEQWRLGATGRADRLDFQYSTTATSLTTGTWVNVDQLDFTSPFTSSNSGDVGARDGNAAANRTNIAYTISGLNIAPGATFWIRWNDFNAAGADDGLGIDDFSMIANIAGGVFTISDAIVTEGNSGTVTAQFTITLSQPAGVGGVTFDIATADNTATVADNDYVANSVIGANIPEGSTTYTFDVVVNGDTNVESTETFFVNVTNLGGAAANDTQGVGTIGTDDFTFTRIHAVQGSGNVSPLNGSVVTVGGIVTGIKSGGSGGFFVQEEETDYDADPTTSEGIFVFTGGSLPAGVAIGNTVAVTGTVVEFPASAVPHGVTELTSVTVNPLGAPQALPAPMVITVAEGQPTSNVSQYERYEGMRVSVPSMTVVAPTQGSTDEVNATGSSNGVFYGVVTGVPRPFREPGIEQTATVPSEATCAACIDRFDTNPEKFRVDSDNQPGATQLNVTAGQIVTGIVGPLDFGFFEYTILPDAGSNPVVTGDSTYDPVRARTANELTVSAFNLERFYDTTDAPAPTSDAVLTAAAFNNRLNKASLAIRNVLLSPDVIGVVEVENLTTLQSLAARINSDSGGAVNYVAYLQEGNDIGGIDVGFLVNTNRVTVQSVTQIGKTATFIDPSDSSVDLLNDRPSLVLEASIMRSDSSIYEFVTIVNHLRSLNGVDTNDGSGQRVRAKRAAQAEYLANYVQARQVADPTERIVLVGDFNAFEFNDGYVDVIGTIKGTPTPAEEVVRPSPDLVEPNLINLVDTVPQAQRYSYSFDGNAQVLDHALVNQTMYATFNELLYGRLDADFPEIFRTDATRPERISDHDALVAYFDISTPSQISIDDPSVVEGNAGTSTLTFTVTLNAPSVNDITVNYTTSNGTATAGSDYVAKSGTVTFLAGDTSEWINIDVTGDTIFEADETVVVTLSTVTGNATIADATGTGTILNDDPVLISIADSSVVEGNVGTTPMTFTVTLAAPATGTVTVNYATTPGTATAVADFIAETGTVTFAPGDTSEEITIDVVGDVLFEPNETFTVTLSSPSANGAISDGSATGTITNDDGVTLINISDAMVAEGNAGTSTLTFTVTLTAPAVENVTVNYATANGTATAESGDYVAETGTVTFTPGDQSETITIDVNGDLLFEANETMTVTLSNASVNANIADGTGTGTITNDDAVSVINISDANVTEGNSGTTVLTFTVTLDAPAAGTVTVNYATSDGTATTAGGDYVAASGTVTFVAGDISEQITITVNGDTNVEPNETLTVTLSNPSANASINDGTGIGTITNDDAIAVINISDASVTEGNSGTTVLTFNVTLDAAPTGTITVNYATSDGTATTAGGDYVAATGTVTFVAGDMTEQITITVNGDTSFEPNETLTVTLSNPSANASINDGTGTGTILNDDSSVAAITATKTVAPATAGIGENVTYTIVATNNGPQSATNVVVTDDLPAGMTLVSASSTQGTCGTTDPVVCTIGTLANGSSATVTIVARLPFTPGVAANTATVSSNENVVGTTSGTANVTVTNAALSNIPTLSEYALFAMMAMLAAIAVAKMR
jgi:hypothetical protein